MADERPWAGRRLHLIGLGGAGMSGYARVAAQLGAEVSGSDRADSPALAGLRELGVEVHVGHDASNLPAGDGVEVVHSSAIAADNPERVEAARRGLPDRPRADLLAELSALKRTIAVAGTHGKTTTTSMAAHVLLRCGMAPAYLIGGALRTTGLNADWGAGEWLVLEADESDRSMLALDVDVAVVTNVELDHHATFGSLAEVRDVFRMFLGDAGQAVLWERPDVLVLRGGRPYTGFDAPEPVLEPGGSRFEWRGGAGRRDDRRRADARASPGGRRLPAPPVLAHGAPRARVRRGFGDGRPPRGARRLPRARARRGLPGGQRAPRGRGDGRRRRRARGALAAGLRRRRARPARAPARRRPVPRPRGRRRRPPRAPPRRVGVRRRTSNGAGGCRLPPPPSAARWPPPRRGCAARGAGWCSRRRWRCSWPAAAGCGCATRHWSRSST